VGESPPVTSEIENSRAAVLDEGVAPSVASASARIPASTHALLDELFKARITAVKRISRDQLR
jgi:hypothetical protein